MIFFYDIFQKMGICRATTSTPMATDAGGVGEGVRGNERDAISGESNGFNLFSLLCGVVILWSDFTMFGDGVEYFEFMAKTIRVLISINFCKNLIQKTIVRVEWRDEPSLKCSNMCRRPIALI
jgi:hypothetical protein